MIVHPGSIRVTRRSCLLGGTATALLFASGVFAHAAEWPTRRVTIIVPYAAGGLADLVARLCAQVLTEKFGQPFLVENRPAAGGIVAAQYVANAKPDGHTLLLGAPGPLLIVPMIQTVSYDLSQFAPISIVEHAPLLLAINSSLHARTLAEFLLYAKANPGRLNYASGGVGAVTHLIAALFASRAGIDMVHVPYRGTSAAIVALLSGEVSMFFSTPSEVLPYLSDDRIAILGVSSSERLSALPNIPTIGETFAGFSLDSWEGILTTAGTPHDIVETMADALIHAAKSPWMIERMAKLGVFPGGSTPAEFANVLVDDKKLYRAAVKAAGLALQ